MLSRTKLPVFALLWLIPATFATGDERATSTVVDGVKHWSVVDVATPLSIHVVQIEIGRQDLAVVTSLGNGSVFDLQTVPAQMEAFEKAWGTPIAAVNGDYCEMGFSGDPRYRGTFQGIHMRGGELVHGPAADSFWIDAKGRPHLTTGASPQFSLTWPDGSKSGFGLNCSTSDYRSEVGASDIVLFTPVFGDSTRTEGGLELVLAAAPDSEWLPLRANCSHTGVIQSMSRKGNTRIAKETMVLSVVNKRAATLPPLEIGDRLTFTTPIKPELVDAREAVGGGPMLILDGKRRVRPSGKESEKSRHPRTAVGFNDTHLFLVVVDGRRPKVSRGMSHAELADFMDKLGCTSALNLDGGGSSTMWFDGKVVNRPSDRTGPRAVGNALVIVKQPGGDAAK